MAGQVNIGGSNASVQLTGNDDITQNQEVLFPDTAGAPATVVVSPGTADIETTGDLDVGSITAAGNIRNGDQDIAKLDTAGVINYAVGAIRVQRSNTNGSSFILQGYRGTTNTCEILADGSIFASGPVDVGGGFKTGEADNSGMRLSSSGPVQVQDVAASVRKMWRCYAGTVETSWIQANGDAKFAGDITTHKYNISSDTGYGVYIYKAGNAGEERGTIQLQNTATSTSTSKVLLIRRGTTIVWSVTAAGNLGARGIEIELEPENPASYTVTQEEYQENVTGPLGQIERTVTKTREVREYTGPVMNVRETLQSLLSRAEQQDAVIADLTRQLTELKGAN